MAEQSFDVEAVIAYFEESLHEDEEDVIIPSYLQAYEELSRLVSYINSFILLLSECSTSSG